MVLCNMVEVVRRMQPNILMIKEYVTLLNRALYNRNVGHQERPKLMMCLNSQ
jgi:hypothetical protein